MKNHWRTACLSFFLLWGWSSCGYEDPEYTQAIVRDFGPMATDGCGFMLEIPNKAFYAPDFLPPSYQQDGMKVQIKYMTNDTVHICGIGATKYPKLILLEIQR